MSPNEFSLVSLGPLTRPLTKLIETIGDAIGVLYEPTRIRRKAEAEASALIIQSQAEAVADSLAQRANRRVCHQEERRQTNLESIVGVAATNLPEVVSDDPVSQDWVAHFIGAAQDVGDAELQRLWSRVLAGEVTTPGSYSRRTIESLRMASRDDGRLFEIAANHATRLADRSVIITNATCREYLQGAGLYAAACDHLIAIGLLRDGLVFPLKKDSPVQISYFLNACAVVAAADGKSWNANIDFYHFTATGEEILRLCQTTFQQGYWDAVIAALRANDALVVTVIETRTSQ